MGADQPEERNYDVELAKTLGGQQRVMPALYAAESLWQPQWAQLAGRVTGQMRDQQMSDVEQFGPRATQATLNANPYNRALLDKLNASANEDLDLGSAVSPETMRQIRNSLLAERGGMGWGYDPGDMAAVGMSTGMQGEQLKSERQARALRTLNSNQSVLGDVFTRVLGTPGLTAQAPMGNAIFDPESSYAGNLNNSNQAYDWRYKEIEPSGIDNAGRVLGLWGQIAGGFAGGFGG